MSCDDYGNVGDDVVDDDVDVYDDKVSPLELSCCKHRGSQIEFRLSCFESDNDSEQDEVSNDNDTLGVELIMMIRMVQGWVKPTQVATKPSTPSIRVSGFNTFVNIGFR